MGRILLSICGAVLAGLLVGAAPPPNERAQAEQAQATRDLTNAVEALSRNVAEQSKAGQPSELERPCEPGQESRGSDLCAQWKAADAAREAARWTFWSMLVGVAGVLGLVWNLRQGRAALTKAREANEIARDSAERQLRAYLTVEDFTFGVDFEASGAIKHLSISTTIKNTGQTPAFVRQSNTLFGYYPVPETPVSMDEALADVPIVNFVLGSGVIQTMKSRGTFTAIQMKNVFQKKARVFVLTCLKYTDIFEKARVTYQVTEILVLRDPAQFQLGRNGEMPNLDLMFKTSAVPDGGCFT